MCISGSSRTPVRGVESGLLLLVADVRKRGYISGGVISSICEHLRALGSMQLAEPTVGRLVGLIVEPSDEIS